jgi:sugar phosphate isomerase/epimerase
LLPTKKDIIEIASVDENAGPVEEDKDFNSQVDSALEEIGKRADRYGVTLSMRSELSSLAGLERAIRASSCPWFGVDLDPVAMLRDSWSVDEVFSQLGSVIKHVRGRDANRGADRRTRPAMVGQGSVKWDELVANLDQAHYQGWVTIDPMELENRVEGARAGLEYLKLLK